MYVDPLEHESIREFVWTWGIPAYPPLLYANLRGKMMILRMVDVPEFVCMYCTHVDLLSSHLKMMLNLCVQEGCGMWPVTKDYMLFLPAQLRHITTFIYIIYMYHIISIILCWLQKNLHGSQNCVSETNGEQLSWERNHEDGTLCWWVWIIFVTHKTSDVGPFLTGNQVKLIIFLGCPILTLQMLVRFGAPPYPETKQKNWRNAWFAWYSTLVPW